MRIEIWKLLKCFALPTTQSSIVFGYFDFITQLELHVLCCFAKYELIKFTGSEITTDVWRSYYTQHLLTPILL